MAWREYTGKGDEGAGFYFEAPGDPANVLVLFANAEGGITAALAEEFPMDSYNETFECKISLPPDQARRLRDYLVKHFPT